MKYSASDIKKLKRYLDKGLSRRECASLLGINVSTVAYWIAGHLPSYATTKRELQLASTFSKRHEQQARTSAQSQTALDHLRRGRTLQEIATTMGTTIGRVRSLLQQHKDYPRIKEALKEYLSNKRKEEREAIRIAASIARSRRVAERKATTYKQQQLLTRANKGIRSHADKERQIIQARRNAALSKFSKIEKQNFVEAKLRTLRQNSKHRGIEMNLTLEDLKLPDVCPVLGLPLDYTKSKLRISAGSGVRSENTVSFDRINPKKGYVKGNVLIVSWRANRIKNDGTPEEHAKIARYYKYLT